MPRIYASNQNIFRNLIINGAFDFFQRGATGIAPASGVYPSADRWKYRKSGTVVHNFSQSGLFPTGANSGLLTAPTTALASPGSTDFAMIEYLVEGLDFQNLYNKEFSVGFWVYSTKTGTHSLAFQNSASNRSLVVNYTVNVTNTWEWKCVNAPIATASGSWLYTNGIGLRVIFPLVAGSSFQTSTLDSWQSGNLFSSTTSVNDSDSLSNEFRLSQVMLVPGRYSLQSTDFVRAGLSVADELSLCKRYYQEITGFLGASCLNNSPREVSGNIQLPVEMRTSPSVTLTASSLRTRDNTFNQVTGTGQSVGGTTKLLTYSVSAAGGTFAFGDSVIVDTNGNPIKMDAEL